MDQDNSHRDGSGESGSTAGAGGAPSIEESLRQVGAAGKEGLSATLDAGRALRRLFAADVALARVALARALVWLAVTVAFGSSAWLMLMGAVIALLVHLGWSWLAAFSLSCAISLAIALIGGWLALRYFEMSKLDATRRQLARLGIGGDDDAATSSKEDAA